MQSSTSRRRRRFEVRSGNLRLAWSVTFFVVAAMFVAVLRLSLRRAAAAGGRCRGRRESTRRRGIAGFLIPFVDFFRKPRILAMLAFLLLYRFPEAQLVKLATPFLLDTREVGRPGAHDRRSRIRLRHGRRDHAHARRHHRRLRRGARRTEALAVADGAGDSLAQPRVSCSWPTPSRKVCAVITAAVGVEQFGYGFGFTAYMLYCVYVATRQTRNGALRSVHRLHGAGHDDSRHVERLAAGAHRLPALLRVDHAGDDSELAGRGVHSRSIRDFGKKTSDEPAG